MARERGAVINIRTTVCILMALVLVIVPPVVAAEPQEEGASSGELLPGTCYAVRPGETPPVAVYECPSG